jgi:MYXO-CTERM domain-containing protein
VNGNPLRTGAATPQRRRSRTVEWVLRILGAALLAAMAWIHLDLWLDGYRTIDVVGPAFLLNVLAGFGLAALLLVIPRPLLGWVALLGALTAAGTLAGLLVSTTVGLFGFVETTQAALWWESVWVEVAAFVVLGVLAALTLRRRRAD